MEILVLTEALIITQSLLLGSMLFFAAIVAPSVFKFVPEKEAGIFLRGIFPRYYVWGLVLSAAMTVMGVLVSLWLALTSLAILVLFVVARQILMPAINQTRDLAKQGDPAASKQFARLHLLSVVINLLQMLMLLSVTVYLVMR